MNSVMESGVGVKVWVTVEKHPKIDLWKVLVLSSRPSRQPPPYPHPMDEVGAKGFAEQYAAWLGVEYVEPGVA